MAREAPPEKSGRPLTSEERDALLEQPLVGVLSTLSPTGWIHSVPVHFFVDGDDVRMVVGRTSVKCRNAERTGRATLCVETSTADERTYVTLEGSVRVEAITSDDLMALDAKYSRSDASGYEEDALEDDVMLVVRPERWIAWTDWD